MKGSLKVLRIFGIDVRVHFTFVFILLLAALESGHRQGPRGAAFGAISVACLFVCVTLHELGHSLVARRFGVPVHEIVLLPIGGYARMGRGPSRPLHELIIAVAGPLVNVLIAVGLIVALGMQSSVFQNEAALLAGLQGLDLRALLLWLLVGNVWLALFNMLPALPMDGGRVLRATLSFWLGKARATAIAARVGQVLALGMVAFGLIGPQPLLALIGLFVYFAAGEERASGQVEEGLAELTAGEVIGPPGSVLQLGDDLGDVVDHALRSQQSAFAVVSDSDLLGVVLRDDVLALAPRLGLRASIGQVLRRGLPICDAATPLLAVRDRIAETGLPVVVVDEGRFVGLLGAEDLTRIARVTSRLATAGIRRPVEAAPAPADAGS